MKKKIRYYEPIINAPDYQGRILKNNGKIKYKNKVHEVLDGYETYGYLPTLDTWCIIHKKDIKKQCLQNELYQTITENI